MPEFKKPGMPRQLQDYPGANPLRVAVQKALWGMASDPSNIPVAGVGSVGVKPPLRVIQGGGKGENWSGIDPADIPFLRQAKRIIHRANRRGPQRRYHADERVPVEQYLTQHEEGWDEMILMADSAMDDADIATYITEAYHPDVSRQLLQRWTHQTLDDMGRRR